MKVLKGIGSVLLGSRRLRLPNFFITGAARSGSTSMWKYLQQHPDIFMPPEFNWKEPSYFCDSYGVHDWDQYLQLFADAGNVARIGEASGPYLTSPESPRLIQQRIPDARIIILLRNPVERALSLYRWMLEQGYERFPTFQQALEAEDNERYNNDWFQQNHGQYYHNFLYYHSGCYQEQVQRFFDTFGRDRVLVLVFEEMIESPVEHVQRVFRHLEVDPDFCPEIKVHNANSIRTDWDPSLRCRLRERYQPEIERVEDLLGRDLQMIWD